MIRRLLARWRRRGFVDSGEVCRECWEPIDRRDLWEARVDFDPLPEEVSAMGGLGGGTYGTTPWCGKHRPADATRKR